VKILDLLPAIYKKAAVYGYFGYDLPELTWEATDGATALKAST
jgi:S-adenosylmethionine synthetase